MDSRPSDRTPSRRTARGACMDVSDEDENSSAPSTPSATLRSMRRTQISSRPMSPTALHQEVLPGLPPNGTHATTPTPPDPDSIRFRPSRQHSTVSGRAISTEHPTQPLPHRLKRSQKQIAEKDRSKPDVRSNETIVETNNDRLISIAAPEVSQVVSPARPSIGSRRKSHDPQSKSSSKSTNGLSAGTITEARSSSDDHTKRRLHKPKPEARPDTVPEDVDPQEIRPGPTEPRVLSLQSNAKPLVIDPRKMLQLMRKTRGRMKGELSHRASAHHAWSTSDCTIIAESGTLVSKTSDAEDSTTLFQDLRGCKVQSFVDADAVTVELHILSKDKSQRLQIQPTDQASFNTWFAALLCWRPVHPGQSILDDAARERTVLIRQVYDYLPKVDTEGMSDPIRKLGSAVLIEPDESRIGQPVQVNAKQGVRTTWTVVSCTLRGRGELRLHSKDLAFVASVSLSLLPRSAIQRLSTSVLDVDCVIAIYPQYAQDITACTRIRPIYLSFESQELFEVWFVLLRAHAIPELFGANRTLATAENSNSSEVLPGLARGTGPDLFRVITSFHVKVLDAKLWGMGIKKSLTDSGEESHRLVKQKLPAANYFVEIMLDGQTKGKTSVKVDSAEPLWYEQIELADFAVASSTLSVRVKKQDLARPTFDKAAQPSGSREGTSDSMISETTAFGRPDITCGEVSLETYMIQEGVNIEGKHALVDEGGMAVGEVSLSLRYDTLVALMDREYEPLTELLLRFSNSLTQQIAQRIPLQLAQLSQTLLNIFQVAGQSLTWLKYLVEEEIDGSKDPVPTRSRFARRLETPESRESLRTSNTPNREEFVRDVGRAATAEVNLLFRGNTLLSKALDAHMKRLGRDYLEMTLGAKLRAIALDDLDCEVDSAKAVRGHDIQIGWKRLIALTEDTWTLIRESAEACPYPLRSIFRHIRACAEDRYGNYMRNVGYSSVSGFLFLRFFGAAVLNPQLFHLVEGSPSIRAQRTFTLLAKSLQGLANMTTFGSKEPFMAPMNAFLNTHRQDFKDFIDDICATPVDSMPPTPASYTIPLSIYQKSPVTSREGFLSLPHLIDRARQLAILVNLWLDNVGTSDEGEGTLPGGNGPMTSELARFHDLCLGLRQRSQTVFRSADRADRVPSALAHKWVSVTERMEVVPEDFWVKHHRIGKHEMDSNTTSGRASDGSESLSNAKRSEKRIAQDAMRRQTALRQRAISQPVASAAVYNGAGEGRPSTSSSEDDEHGASSAADSDRGRGSHRKFWSRKRHTRTPDRRDEAA